MYSRTGANSGRSASLFSPHSAQKRSPSPTRSTFHRPTHTRPTHHHQVRRATLSTYNDNYFHSDSIHDDMPRASRSGRNRNRRHVFEEGPPYHVSQYANLTNPENDNKPYLDSERYAMLLRYGERGVVPASYRVVAANVIWRRRWLHTGGQWLVIQTPSTPVHSTCRMYGVTRRYRTCATLRVSSLAYKVSRSPRC